MWIFSHEYESANILLTLLRESAIWLLSFDPKIFYQANQVYQLITLFVYLFNGLID